MGLPNLSYMMNVGQLRYIQSIYEVPEHRNPDALIHNFLSHSEIWGCRLRGMVAINRLRRNPFYYYVLARTRHYDAVFASAIEDGAKCILNIGCGSDTRAYRYVESLKKNGVACTECDQSAAIVNKEKLVRARLDGGHVDFMSIDLNAGAWPEFERWLAARAGSKFLVMMEGVSPYIDEKAFRTFLSLLNERLLPGSRVAYDFKLKGVSDRFGQADVSHVPFRLSGDAKQIDQFHSALGFRVDGFELGSALVGRTLPGVREGGWPAFEEDALVQLTVEGAKR